MMPGAFQKLALLIKHHVLSARLLVGVVNEKNLHLEWIWSFTETVENRTTSREIPVLDDVFEGHAAENPERATPRC
jgi:hypothetical protein